MITINSYQDNPFFSISKIGDTPRHKLPLELELTIFSFLSPKDLQATSSVCRVFTPISLKIAKGKEIWFLNNFGDFIQKKLPNAPIDKICTLGTEKISKCLNLMGLKAEILDSKENFINELKNLQIEAFTKLKDASANIDKSHFFHNVIYLAALYKKIEELEQHLPSLARDEAFENICKLLSKKGGDLSKAMEVANKIQDKKCKKRALTFIKEVNGTVEVNPSIMKIIWKFLPC